MNRKNLPLLLMLTAGAITSIITYAAGYNLMVKMIVLFVILVVFYVLGYCWKWMLDDFDTQKEKRLAEENEQKEEGGQTEESEQAEETEISEEAETKEEQEKD